MNYLFSNIEEVKRYVSTFSSSFEIEDLQSNLYEAGEKYIIPYIGLDIWEKVLSDYNAETLSTEHQLLLPYLQRPLIHFTLYHQVPESAVEWQNSGFTQRTGDNYKTADFRDVIKLQRSFEVKAWDNLERLILYIERKVSDYPLYANDDEVRRRNTAHFINNAFTFNMNYDILGGRLTFEGLRPMLHDLEEFLIKTTIGEAYFNELIEEIYNKNISTHNKKPIDFIRKALAYQCIHEAITQKSVRMEGKHIVLNYDVKGYDTKKPALTKNYSDKKYQAYDFAARWLDRLTAILQKNQNDYPSYAAYLDEQAATEEKSTSIFDNADKSIFVV